jgi:large subunit ribosomal protein L17
VLLYETVRTTKKRAEVVRPLIEHIITLAKTKEPQVAIRAINRYVTHTNASKKTMEVLKARYANRSSGYTRMVPLGARHGDGAKLVNLMLMDNDTDVAVVEKPAKKEKAPKAAKTPKAKKTSASSASSATSASSNK